MVLYLPVAFSVALPTSSSTRIQGRLSRRLASHVCCAHVVLELWAWACMKVILTAARMSTNHTAAKLLRRAICG
jgi:hypothetical protein